jgi:hypothetical protein
LNLNDYFRSLFGEEYSGNLSALRMNMFFCIERVNPLSPE